MKISDRDKLLDGWRGIAILAVIVGHAVFYRFGRLFPPISLHDAIEQSSHSMYGVMCFCVSRLGWASMISGVDVFFAISGYIITLLLIRERQRQGFISIKAFYIRRAFRVLPAFAFYVATCCILRQIGEIRFELTELYAVFTFTVNWRIVPVGWFLGHMWSLSVEEQFYLVWPICVSLLPSRNRTSVLIGLSVILSAMTLAGVPATHAVSFNCISLGALYACNEAFRDLIRRTASWGGFLAVFTLIAIQPNLMKFTSVYNVMQALMPLGVVYLIFSSREIAGLRSIIESAPLRMVGIVSYSLYLWQQLLTAYPDAYLLWQPPLWILPCVSILSYFIIEVPCIRIGRLISAKYQGKRIEAVRTTDRHSSMAGESA